MENTPNHPELNTDLRDEILDMVRDDQEMRVKMREGQEVDPEIDRAHTTRMKQIIETYGWPSRTLVSEQASQGAWLLVQHADHDPVFQAEVLELLKEAVGQGEASKTHLAYLVDRVKVNNNEPQLFGTQFYKDGAGEMVPREIAAEEQLEKRRKEYGLEPFTKYEQWFKN